MSSSVSVSAGNTSRGIGYLSAIGVAIAVQISWGLNHAIGWALLHGLLGWVYVLYRWILQSY